MGVSEVPRGRGSFLWVLVGLLLMSAVGPSLAEVAFVSPATSVCSVAGTCDGTLQNPFATIDDALTALPATEERSSIVLLPGTYTGAGNRGITISNRALSILAGNPQTTIIDCEGSTFAFSFNVGIYTLSGLTIQNCGSTAVSAAVAIANGDLYIGNTRWVSNTGPTGGAIFAADGEIKSVGSTVNRFLNNDALNDGGGLGATNSDITLNGFEQFSGNSVGGNTSYPSANIFADSQSSILFPPSGSVPALTVGPSGPYPVTYVDLGFDCIVNTCTGSESEPFNNLQDTLTGGPAQYGGTIALMPGVYTGPLNRDLTYGDVSIEFIQWPGSTGSVVIDCQGGGQGFALSTGAFSFSDITIQNCTTADPEGGGAIRFDHGVLRLTNVQLLDNSATAGPGGALAVSQGVVAVWGGSFQHNSAAQGGGAISVDQGDILLYNSTAFQGNLQDVLGTAGDTMCTNSGSVGSDGTAVFEFLDNGNCTIHRYAPSTLAKFSGAMDVDMYPLDENGNSCGAYGGLEFYAIVEIDEYGTEIDSTRLRREELTWTTRAVTNGAATRVRYDAFGPDNQYISVIHDFFTDNTTLTVGNVDRFYLAGSLKTTLQVALWPFLAANHSLAFTMRVRSSADVCACTTAELLANNATLYTVTTGDVVLSFAADPDASYDSGQTVGPVHINEWKFWTQYFQFVFSSFQEFVVYDPDMSVVLNPQTDSEGSDEGSDDAGLIAGLTVGLFAAAVLVVVVVIAGGTALTFYLRRTRRNKIRDALAGGV